MVTRIELLEDVKKIFAEIANVDDVLAHVKKALDAGASPTDITKSMSEGFEEVGRRYEEHEYFLSEVIMASTLATEVSSMLKPLQSTPANLSAGKVVIGTVKGDVHDLGKNIVSTMLMSMGYAVVDLGVDVPAERFIEAVEAEKPDILALSCLMSNTVNQIQVVIDQLSSSGFRKKVKVIIGGSPISQAFATSVGADGYCENAPKALELIKRLLAK
ncbi:cobalamin-dependent protein [Candidatus Bathyarchaeota archaeon]|nr:cobalamin-dependent protein [Candidatus Bathyarchaeota archaeon]